VPRVVGLTYEEAVDALTGEGLDPRRVDVFSGKPPGTVVSQDPKAGTQVDEGTRVTVRVSQGREQIPVPDVLDQSEQSAIDELDAAGFEVEVLRAPDDETPEGLVAAQSPDPGVEAPRGSTVQITVSTGPELLPIPDVVDEEMTNARAILRDAGFRSDVIRQDVDDPELDGIVLSQEPVGGTEAPEGTTVTIVVGRFVP
jgi:serine/threonine-protein kinase